ncbi:type II secretion system protein F [Betaproteobacteria bacterium]|nr:type II secretion system protein F [Betaproteobacteria bacterium]GHU02832.1 type II secretion system protein F [Betaproteobacteria bacterium]GHU19222.1 type II secretion system protein F [Betaproteobacteria bacterium]
MATATATAARRPRPGVKETLYNWEGKDKTGRIIKGEMRAASESVAKNSLRRQGVIATKIKKQSMSRGHKVTDKDIAIFTRQLATMMKAGVPMLQAFDIGIKGSGNPGVSRLLNEVRNEVEAGSSLAAAFGKFPLHFDKLFCNLVNAGEQAGILDNLLDRLATYKEKILAIKSKIKSALFYPTAIVLVATIVVAVIMLFVVPAFKKVFADFGAELPGPTLVVMGISDFFVDYWYLIFGILFGGIFGTLAFYKRSQALQISVDRAILKLPVIGDIIRKATVARWTRTLSTMFAAGVPLTEALDSVGGAAGNHVYLIATRHIQNSVGAGTSLTNAMQDSHVFPSMVVQMVSIGEESGQLDTMLSKVADFYEQEVDDAVAALSSLLEPIIMVFLGVVIGGLVVAMYLPIFKLAAVV